MNKAVWSRVKQILLNYYSFQKSNMIFAQFQFGNIKRNQFNGFNRSIILIIYLPYLILRIFVSTIKTIANYGI